LDFLPPSTANTLAIELNDDLEEYCATSPTVTVAGRSDVKRLYGYGLIPLVPNNSVDSILQVIKQISTLPHLKGVIMGTKAVGKGLDDPEMEPVWHALSEAGLVVFLHPHYGLGSGAKEAWGERENGHVLSLAIGFPTETTIVRPPWSDPNRSFKFLILSFPSY
jgi:aminocarboxymuconate-semialdehyde decarboxylase